MPVSIQGMMAPGARPLALVAAVARLAEAQSLEEIIAIVRDTARRVSGADGVTFVLRDGENCHYIEEDAIGPLWKGKRFPLTACISGWCMNHGEMAVIPDIYADPRIPHDAYRPTFVKSLVMAPVGSTHAMAAIGSYWADHREFDASELALLDALARSTAAAISAVAMRKAVEDREARLGIAIDAGRLGTWDWVFHSDAIRASAPCREHFARGPDDRFSHSDLLSATRPDDRDRLSDAMHFARHLNTDLEIEFRTLGKDGRERWLEMRGRVTMDENGEPARMSGVTLDVTDRVNAKDRIDRLQTELAHLGRVTDMSKMVSALAHELNQPLTAAKAYMSAAHRMLAGNPDASDADEAITKASDQFARASSIIERTRGFVSKTEVNRTSQPVRPMLEEAIELSLLDPRHRAVGVETDIAEGLPSVVADKIQIQQVLLNLLRNAYEAMASDKACARPAVTVSARRNGDGIECMVSDNGPGLSSEVAANLFKPFQTTKSSGMGVGLSICRGLIESNGGQMSHVPSDKGACFAFTLPAAGADA